MTSLHFITSYDDVIIVEILYVFIIQLLPYFVMFGIDVIWLVIPQVFCLL